jgi:hypothetical protein
MKPWTCILCAFLLLRPLVVGLGLLSFDWHTLLTSPPPPLLFSSSSFSTAAADTSATLTADVALAIDALRQASVPMTVDTAISITISEFFAGSAGGAVSRIAANIIGDKKKDSFQTKVSTTGAFFGTRAAVRGLARMAGLPRPLALLCSSVVASVVSETLKGIGRKQRQEEEEGAGGIVTDADQAERQGLKASEIAGDVSKWLIYDYLEDRCREVIDPDRDFVQLVLVTFFIGCVAATAATALKAFIEQRNQDPTGKEPPFDPDRGDYFALAIEGGVLFASFQVVLKVVKMTVPSELNQPFVFNSFIRDFERILAPEVVSSSLF